MNRESGFTLIEIIVSLVLAGIMATAAGMALVTATKGYLFARENAHMAQKSQFAMARLSRELMELTDVTSATNTSIVYERSGGQYGIAKVGDVIKIREGTALPDATNGDALIDNVDSLTLSYFKKDQPWQAGTDNLKLLSAIQIDLVIPHSDSGVGNVSFSTTVHPRNNGNYGGAPSTASPPTKSSYGCFVATATYGQSDHPMALVLRQFRDRFLLTWKGGRIMVSAYYSIGAKLAEKIKDRPGACFMVRFLLLPIVGVAFLMLHAPAVIPLILLLSWLVTRTILHRTGGGIYHRATLLRSQKGAVLIGLIITIVLLSALGAAILPMTTTSTFSQAGANSAARAYFLAESGYRYAASEYLNAANESAKETVLEALHNQTFTLAGNGGQFHLDVYPYWYKTTADPSASANKEFLETKVLGGFSPDLNPFRGYLRIGSNFYQYKAAVVSGPNVTFENQFGNWPSIGVGSMVYPVCLTKLTTLTKGGDLEFQPNTGADAFPLRNGQFELSGNIYTYRERDLSNKYLRGITDPDDPNMPDVLVPNNSNIILQKFVQLHSTGTVGQGAMATSREINFSASLSGTSSGGGYYDTFENKDNWKPSTYGSHGITSVDGNKALDVTDTTRLRAGGERERESLIALDWGADFANLDASWRAGGYFLGYDTQIKVKAAPRAFYMAGINLRMNLATSTMLGVSFLKGDNSATDRIPDGLVPVDDTPLIVLWQSTGSSINDLKWLAYRELTAADHAMPPAYFSDDMEGGPGGWDASGYQFNQWGQVTNRSHSAATSWNDSPGGDYSKNEDSSLISTSMDLSGIASATLVFWHRHNFQNDQDDMGRVYISTNGGGNWTLLATYSRNLNTWTEVKIDISSYLPSADVKIGFRFTSDNDNRRSEGWYIDDVSIEGSHPEWDTIVVRMEENVAESDPFNGQRVNNIKVYVGATSGYDQGNADGSPLDAKRHGNPRWNYPPAEGEIHWPPDTVAEWAAANDYFTLIRGWVINGAEPSIALTGTVDEPNATLRMNTFTTPFSGTFTQEEIGLHTFGETSTSVYFDDFAIKLPGAGGSGFSPPIQQ